MVAGTWLGAFGALIPTWRGAWGQFGLDQIIGSCSILRDENRKCYNHFIYCAHISDVNTTTLVIDILIYRVR